MKIGSMYSGKNLKASDIDEQLTLTIESVGTDTMKDNTGHDVTKPVIQFRDEERGLVLNVTNSKLVTKALGSDDTDDWIGRKITLYVADVEFKGDIVPAIRVKAKAPKSDAGPTGGADIDDSEIPF